MGRQNKAKRTQPAAIIGDGPTPERLARDDWQKLDAPRMAGERWNAKVQAPHVQRRLNRSQRLLAHGWITKDEKDAIDSYEDLVDRSGYGHRRSCLDRTPPANDHDGSPALVVAARARLAFLRNAVAEHSTFALTVLDTVLFPAEEFGPETLDQVAGRLFSMSGEKRRMIEMRAQIEVSAWVLHEEMSRSKKSR